MELGSSNQQLGRGNLRVCQPQNASLCGGIRHMFADLSKIAKI